MLQFFDLMDRNIYVFALALILVFVFLVWVIIILKRIENSNEFNRKGVIDKNWQKARNVMLGIAGSSARSNRKLKKV